MATFKAEIQNKRNDGTYNVRIRVTHNREIRRISTNIYVTSDDLTRNLKIKNVNIIDKYNDLIRKCNKFCEDLGFQLFSTPIEEFVDKLKKYLQGGNRFYLDFIEYTRIKATEMEKGTGDTYLNMLNALRRFIKRDNVDISINTNFLREFEKFIATEPSQRGSNRLRQKKELEAKGGRAISKYLSCGDN